MLIEISIQMEIPSAGKNSGETKAKATVTAKNFDHLNKNGSHNLARISQQQV